jgi:UDP-N-acetylmuramate dehydrogenase
MKNWNVLADKLAAAAPSLELRRNEPMSRHTTFRVGGPAALMALPRSEEELLAAVAAARSLGEEPVLVGNGSNLLVDDAGLDAFVVKTVPGLSWCRTEETHICAGSGLLLSALANEAARRGLTGLEFAQGIPGSLGGGVCMNAGAYGGELCQVIRSVRVLEPNGQVTELTAEECGFGYRHSVFSDGKRIVLSAGLTLEQGDSPAIRAVMSDLAARRREKQPLDLPSAGSTFKRPAGHYAAALIDQCGLKGMAIGGAQVSTKHAGFVVNTGMATCKDILDLMGVVEDRVYRVTGVKLEPEVKYLK